MGNGAGRILNVIQKSNVNTISSTVFLTVTSISPLVFKLEDRLSITSDFYILSDDIIVSRLTVGTIVIALTFDDGQRYFIEQALDTNLHKIKSLIIDNLNSTSIIDSLSANQGRVINQLIQGLDNRLTIVEGKVSTLEGEMAQAQSDIISLDARVTALERR